MTATVSATRCGGGEVVGDEQDGATVVDEAAQLVEGAVDQRRVEAGGGFVGEQQRRVAGQGEGGDDALRHAAGQLVRVAVQVAPGQARPRRRRRRRRVARAAGRWSAAAVSVELCAGRCAPG